jgi:hypothetical protein
MNIQFRCIKLNIKLFWEILASFIKLPRPWQYTEFLKLKIIKSQFKSQWLSQTASTPVKKASAYRMNLPPSQNRQNYIADNESFVKTSQKNQHEV